MCTQPLRPSMWDGGSVACSVLGLRFIGPSGSLPWSCLRVGAIHAVMVLLSPQGSVTPMDYALAKCYLPREDMVLITYCVAAGCLMLITLIPTGLVSAPFHFGQRVLRKFKTM